MPEKIIPASDAVYVAEDNPWKNYSHSAVINVGFSGCLPVNRPLQNQPPHRSEHIGLLQFEVFDSPDNHEILNAQLHLFVSCAHSMVNRIRIYPNSKPFNGNTVTWMTKPAIQPAPAATLFVEREREGHYAACDITRHIKDSQMVCKPGFGFSLRTDRKTADGVAFCSNRATHPPYVSIQYCKGGSPSPPCPPHTGIVENLFCEYTFEVNGTGDALFTRTIEVSRAQTITFFVKNTGVNSFSFSLQISPDRINFLDDKQICRLEANEIKALTPYLFAKYMRVRLHPALAGGHINAHIWCQMQTHNYLVK